MLPLVLDGDLLPGLLLAIYGVAFWTAGVLVAAYLWRRVRGDGPASRVEESGGVDAPSVRADEPGDGGNAEE